MLLVLPYFQTEAQLIDSALYTMSSQYQQDKIYIQYDKDYYVAGETIWFKAYLKNTGNSGVASKNFYLQFINDKGQIVSTKKYPVIETAAKGAIQIPDFLPQGNYYIRAFTPDMLNYDEAFIYKKNIPVFNPTKIIGEPERKQKKISVQFFPESGNMLDGVATTVAFNATDEWGLPVQVKGNVIVEGGSVITSLNSYHDGIGRIQFTPVAGKKYIAEIETNTGKKTYPLPEVKVSGIVLKVADEMKGKQFEIFRTEKDKEKFENLLLVVQMNNQMVYKTEIVFEDYPSVVGHLLTENLPSGILHFTVFDKTNRQLGERLAFVDNGEYIENVVLDIKKDNSPKGTQDSIEINSLEMFQLNGSTAVTVPSAQALYDNDNIYSRFLLTSELENHIFNPAWYFEKSDDSTHLAMDNLMITQSWSKFNWAKILAKEFPVIKYKEQQLIFISGKVMDEKGKKLLSAGNLNINMVAEDSTAKNIIASVEEDGTFKIDNINFAGKALFSYAYTDKQNKSSPSLVYFYNNGMDSIREKVPSTWNEHITVTNFSGIQKSDVDDRYKYISSMNRNEVKELKRVTVQSKKIKRPSEIINEKYTSGLFRAPGKVYVDNINDPASDGSQNVAAFVLLRIKNIELQGGRFVNSRTISVGNSQKWPVVIFLNEIPSDAYQLNSIKVESLALIKFFDAFAGVGSESAGGVIAIYTKKGVDIAGPLANLPTVEYSGYSLVKPFKDNVADRKGEVNNGSTTLYWNPDIITNNETKSLKLNFFNKDFNKKLQIIVEGVNASGKLIHLERLVE